MKKLFFITGESSGDLHGANLLLELYKLIPKEDLIVHAIGSNRLKDAGADIFFDSRHLGSVGLTDVINNLSLYLNLEKELLNKLAIFRPNVLILIDFPGFNLRIAKKVKKLFPEIKIVYYLPPQVWAWNQGRTKILKENCDLVLCGLPFEEDFHKSRGVNAFYTGNPVLSELDNFDRNQIRNELKVKNGTILIGLFPGSRKSEIKYMLPVLLTGMKKLLKSFSNCSFIISQAESITKKEILKYTSNEIPILEPGNNRKLLCASDIVWLTSGTVTLEAALYETPLILGYRSNWLNYSLYLLLKRINFIGLPNIISNERLVPELIQQNAKGENYFENTKVWLENPDKLNAIKTKLKQVKEKLGNKNASHEAALKIRELIPEYKVCVQK